MMDVDIAVREQAIQPFSVNLPLTIRGRHISEDDLKVIVNCIQEHFDKSRTYLSLAICEKLNWLQPNGWPQDRACRDILSKLEQMKLVTLPPRPIKAAPSKPANTSLPSKLLSSYDLRSPIVDMPPNIELEFAKGNKQERVWNAIVSQHHYLGHRVVVGRCIKYLVVAGDRLLGGIAFSSPAWRVHPRDALLRAMGLNESLIHNQVINNNRFLILPNVRVKNLASKVLSIATEKVVVDWSWYYGIRPLVAETFVDPSRFSGTCYKAANWIEAGITKGYAKKGSYHHNSQVPKNIFLYGLDRKTRQHLHRLTQEPNIGINREVNK